MTELKIMLLMLCLIVSALPAQEALVIRPGKIAKSGRSGVRIDDPTPGNYHQRAETFSRIGISADGLMFERSSKKHGGGHGLGVWDPRTFRHFFELYQGSIVRPGPGEGSDGWQYLASKIVQDRDREMREEYPKIRMLRYLSVIEPGFESWPKDKQIARVKQLRLRRMAILGGTDAGAKAVQTNPAVYMAGMGEIPYGEWANYYAYVGAISPDLKSFYLYEYDETRDPRCFNWGPKEPPGALYLVDMATGERRPTPVQVDGKPAMLEEISSDLKYGLQFGHGGSVQIFDNQTHHLIKTFSYPEQVEDGHFSPDSKRLVVYGYGGTRVWDLASGKLLAKINTKKISRIPQPEWAELDATGRYVWIYHLRRGFPEAQYNAGRHWQRVEKSFAIDPNYQGSFVWDVDKDREVKTLSVDQSIRMEGFGPLPGTAILGADDHLQLIDLNTGKLLAKLMLPEGAPKRQYIFIGKEEPGHWIHVGKWHARVLSRPDGLVLGAVDLTPPEKRQSGASFHYVNWELGPHLEELGKRMAEAPPKKSWWSK